MPHTSPENAPTAKRVLNLKAVLIVTCCGMLFYVLSGWVHAKQILKTRSYLKDAAEQALRDEDPTRAFDYFEQFLALKPGDSQAEEHISTLLEEHGKGAKSLVRAFQINEKLLQQDKTRDDLRVRSIRLAERLGRYSDASGHLQALREKDSTMTEVWHFSGIVARDTGDFVNAIKYFTKAIQLQNPAAESFQFLANLLTSESKDPEAASALLDQLVASQPVAKSYQTRADWLIEQKRPQEALRDLWQAAKGEPANLQTNAMLVKAIREARQLDHEFNANQQYQSVVKHLIRVLEEDPDQHKLRLYLSSALWAIGERDAAIANLEFGIQRDPRQFEMHEVLVDYLVSDRRFDRAQEIFDRIPDRAVERGRRQFMRGRLLMAQKRWKDAINALEMAVGYAHNDPNMASRARVCLALCRRETGDNVAAMESYRALIQANPDFEGGRLGMASAYLRADQIPLAIAEYRQLLHVDGVPAFLTNLMIRHTLTLPRGSRDWTEVRDMLRDKDPIVADEVQRILLQADLMFAEGFPAKAMDKLDYAARKMPGRAEIQRAYQRLSSVHGDALHQRVLRLLKEDPGNLEGHVSILRLLVARQDNAAITSWLQNLLSGTSYTNLSNLERLQVVAKSSTTVLETELSTRGASPLSETLRDFANRAWKELAPSSNQHFLSFVRYVAAHQSVDSAMTLIQQAGESISSYTQSQCWLACLRHGQSNEDVKLRVNNELVRLIKDAPSSMALRLAYAENKLLLQQYGQAEAVLQQLAKYDPNSGRALGRLAWIALLINGDQQQGLALSEQASQRSPGDPAVRSVRGLALAEAKQFPQALEVFSAIPDSERSVVSYLFEARALAIAGQATDAAELVREISYLPTRSELAPAESNLLRTLQQQLDVRPRQMTQVSH